MVRCLCHIFVRILESGWNLIRFRCHLSSHHVEIDFECAAYVGFGRDAVYLRFAR